MGKIQDGSNEYANLGDAFQQLRGKEVPDQPKVDPPPPLVARPCEDCGTEMYAFGTNLYSRGRLRIATWVCPKCGKTLQQRELVVR